MPALKQKISEIFNQMADLLDIKGDNEFRVRSYREAAKTVSGLSDDISDIADDEKKIKSLPGLGESMAQKIKEIAETGKLKQLEKLKQEVPETLIDIMKLEQMGPGRTRILYNNLKIKSIEDLKNALKKNKVEKLEGFGKKTTGQLKEEVEKFMEEKGHERFKLNVAEDISAPLIEYLKKKVGNITIAGSYRRNKETVGDIDILVTSDNPGKTMDYFVDYEDVAKVLSKGKSKSSVRLNTGIQVDLRIIEKRSWGAALLYFTGSKAHTIQLRKIGQDKDLKVNEYGIFDGKKSLASETEEEMYEVLGLYYIEPELRENRGEIDASKNHKLPSLIELKDIKGDLHTHTDATDGKYSMEDMVKQAVEFGYSYYAITDHSKKVAMANGLDEKRLQKQIDKIDELNKKEKKIRILKAIEVDILEDGKLDLPNEILKHLDLVVCSIHYNMKLSEKKQTKRVLKAMENPYFNIFAHPTGRRIQEREPYRIDLKEIMKEARDNGCFLEVNSDPNRLDLNDSQIIMAKDIGLKLAVSTDAHNLSSLKNMKYGVAQARRGWLEKEQVINTYTWKELRKMLKRK